MQKNNNRLLVIVLSVALLVFSQAFTLLKPAGRDRTPPTVMLSMPDPTGKNGWYNQPVSIYVYAWDGDRGISDVKISLGGSTWYKRSLTIRKDGTYRVIGRATDKSGNSASVSKIIKVDMTAPTFELIVPEAKGANNWHVQPVKLALNGADNLSGVFQTSLAAEGSFDPLQTGLLDAREMVSTANISQDIVLGNILNEAQAELEIKESGKYQVSGFVEDIAGNRTPVETLITMDMIAPSVQIKSPARYFGEIELVGEMADQESGIEQVWVDYGGGWRRAEFKQGNWSSFWQTEGLTDGEYTIQAKALDKAGNLTVTSYSVTVLNHTWPIFAICGVLLSLGLAAMYDPRRKALRDLTLSVVRYSHMDNSARQLERKMND